MRYRFVAPLALIVACAALPLGAQATTPPDKIAELGGPKYTCMGAERAGTASGVAEYSGKWLDTAPGLESGKYSPGPYAAEKPLFAITAQNMQQYAEHLSEGQKAVLKAYPDTQRLEVYPAHRDFRLPDWACEVVKKNAASAEIKDDGLTATGTTGNLSFPFPQNGLEAIYDVIQAFGVWTTEITHTDAAVYDDGRISWAKDHFFVRNDAYDPKVRRVKEDSISSRSIEETLLPSRSKGEMSTAIVFGSFRDGSTQAWLYSPGTRRVRQAPEVGYDYPAPPLNMHSVDEVNLFNSSPARYDWTILGKKEIYIPINGFKIDDPALKYKDILLKGGLNPDDMRYELHRVWVIQGTLKQGYRHQYGRRVLYVDEDTWLTVMADNYDTRGILWRVGTQNLRYFPEGQGYRATVATYVDLTARDYEVIYLSNEEGPNGWWKINIPAPDDRFGPKALASAGR